MSARSGFVFRGKKRYLISIILIFGLIFAAGFVFAKIELDTDGDMLTDIEELKVYNTDPLSTDTDNDGYLDGYEVINGYSPTEDEGAKLTEIALDIPYIHESSDHSWTGPWKNGCEEASIAMVEDFYLGKKETTVKDSMAFMMMLFNKQDQIWGSNADADAYRANKLINDYTSYGSIIKEDSTVDDIKKELQQKRPVIVPVYGKILNNPNIPFLATGSYYHMIVIVGYDDETNEFITHDNGDTRTGSYHRYKYDILMDSVHDFIFSTRKANGPARAIFTYPKLVKLLYDPRVYYLDGESKQWINNEMTFNARGFNWDAISVVSPTWLINFKTGDDIK